MKARIPFLVLSLFCFANSYAAHAPHAAQLSRYHRDLVSTMIEWEAKTNAVAWQFPMLPHAAAGDDRSCLIAGWEGQMPAGTKSCKRADAVNPDFVKVHCSDGGTVYCNPEVFGDGVCITPSKGNYHWTQSCETRFLAIVGVAATTPDQLNANDLQKVDAYLQSKNFDTARATDPLATLCSKVKQNKDRYASDCESVHSQIVGLSLQVAKSKPDEALMTAKTVTVKATKTPISLKGLAADQCKTVDLSAKTGRVKNQGSIGDCYAFTAVELMNYGAPQDQQISALATAVQAGTYYEQQNNGVKKNSTIKKKDLSALDREVDGFEGGAIADAIAAARTQGACLESAVPSYDLQNSRYLESLRDDFKKASKADCSVEEKAVTANSINNWAQHIFKDMSKQYSNPNRATRKFGAQNEAILNSILDDHSIPEDQKVEAYIRKMVSASCKSGFQGLPTWSPSTATTQKVTDQSSLNRAFQYINDTLAQNFPVGVGYTEAGLLKPKGFNGGHASLVTGRHYVEDKAHPEKSGCYLTIKNSWGTGFPKPGALDNLDASAATDQNGTPLAGFYQVRDVDFAKHLTSVANLGNDPKVSTVLPPVLQTKN